MPCLPGNGRLCETSGSAGRPLWAVMLRNAITVLIGGSLTTPAATAVVPNANRPLAIAGWRSGPRSCCPCPTATSYSPCPRHSLRSPCRINACFIPSCFAPCPRHCWRSRPTADTWEHGSVSSPCYTPGVNNCFRTLTHDTWHYHLLHLQRTKQFDFPHSPRVASACLSEEAARRCSEPARHSNPRGEFPKAPGE